MLSKYIKIIHGQQAKMSNSYIYVELRILPSNAAIWYNKICNTKQLTPKYFHIKGYGGNMQGVF
jgi:hypothetical protein